MREGFAAREILELAASTAGINIGGAGLIRDGGMQDRFRDLHEDGGQTRIGELDINVGPDRAVTINEGGQTIVGSGWKITENGALQARLDSVPDGVLDQFKDKGFEIRSGPEVVDNLIEESHGSIPSNLAGQEVLTPPGTEWITDDQGNFDLIVSGRPDKILLNDAGIGPDGKISFDEASSILNESNIHSETIRTEVLGPDGTWTKEATNVDHREWYSYDQPESQGNELRFYTHKEGDAVILDMTDMKLGYQQGLNPNPIDVQEVIKTHEAGWYFTTANAQQDGLFISDGADGVWDGKLRLDLNANSDLRIDPIDPNSMSLAEASKIILNEQALQKYPDGDIATELYARQDVFNLGQDGKYGFIEAGRMQARPEGNVLQSFATIRGLGPAPESIETTVFRFDTPPVIGHVPTVEIIPPGEREIPIIPFPFSPRHPLEPLAPPVVPPPPIPPYYTYGYGLENLSPEQREEIRRRYSERLRDNPDTKLDARVEIPDYFRRQNPDHMRQLEEYINQPGMHEAMDNNCDAVVCIPVYGLGEGKAISKTLEQYLLQVDKNRNKQAIDPSKFELLLLLNHPEGKRIKKEAEIGHSYTEGAEARVRAGTPEPYDTEEVIRQFQEAHPELKILIMKREYDGENIKPWGTIIKAQYDAALLRASRRINPVHNDPLILTNDADLVNVSPTYMRDILQYMDQNDLESTRGDTRRLDAIVGKIDMPNQGYEREPGFLAAERLYEFIDAQQRRKPNRSAITQGRNTIIRGSAYAAMGGPYEKYGAGADTLIGGALRDARGGTKTIDYLNKAWLYSDPRRELDRWQNNVPLAYAWNTWGDTEMYGEGWQDRFKNLPKNTGRVDVEKLQRDIVAEAWRWGLKFDSPELKRALSWLGLKPSDYHLGKVKDYDRDGNEKMVDGIVVDNIMGVEQRLKNFQTEKRWEKADRRNAKALNSEPSAPLNNKYYAEYTDYEEFDRLKADIFGVKGDGSDSEYPWKPDPANPNPVIIDLGSHIGVSALWWKNIAPGAKITAVEANPGVYDVLERNVKRNNLKSDVTTIPAAVSSQTGNVKFFKPKPGQGWNWEGFIANTNPNPAKYDELDVPTVQLSNLVTGPVDLLKLDIEGSELEVLQEAETKLTYVKEIMMEFHNNQSNSFNTALDLLRRNGYKFEVRENNQVITDLGRLDPIGTYNLTILAKRP